MDSMQAVDLLGRVALTAIVLALIVPVVVLGMALFAHWALARNEVRDADRLSGLMPAVGWAAFVLVLAWIGWR